MTFSTRSIWWILSAALLAAAISAVPDTAQAQDNEAEARRLYNVGMAALDNSDFEIAARNFERSVQLAPRNALARLGLAKVQDKLGRIGDAEENVKVALEIGLDGKWRDEAEQLDAQLEYKRQKRGNSGSAIASMLDDMTSQSSVEGGGGSCSIKRHYFNPRVSGCEVRFSYEETARGTCRSTPEVRDIQFDLSEGTRLAIEELTGFWSNKPGQRYTETGVTNLMVRPESVGLVFDSESEARRMLELLQSYSRVCRGSLSEESRRHTEEQNRTQEQLAAFVGTWVFEGHDSGNSGMQGECSWKQNVSQEVTLRPADGELHGEVHISVDTSTSSRWATGLGGVFCNASPYSSYTKDGTWRVWFDGSQVRADIHTACSGDCGATRETSSQGTLQVDGSYMTRKIGKDTLVYNRQ